MAYPNMAETRVCAERIGAVVAVLGLSLAPATWTRAETIGDLPACMSGPGVAPRATATLTADECLEHFDRDADGDVDLRDTALVTANAAPECFDDADCDDGLFCNGVEGCADGICLPGDNPCPDLMCDEYADSCCTSLCEGGVDPFLPGMEIGTLLGSDVDEASGLVASRQNHDVLWTHNDDYGDNRLFAVRKNGVLLGRYTMGSGAVDPEDIAIGPGPQAGVDYLYWGDIGDNNSNRSSIFVKRAPEPVVDCTQACDNFVLTGVERIVLQYPTGATAPSHKDAETLLVDPLSGDLYVVTKRTSQGQVYRAAYPHSTTGPNVLEWVATLPWSGATGGDISPDGSLIIVRRYGTAAAVWGRPMGTTVADAFNDSACNVSLVSEPQGEAVCWDADGHAYLTVSENSSPGALIPIWFFARSDDLY